MSVPVVGAVSVSREPVRCPSLGSVQVNLLIWTVLSRAVATWSDAMWRRSTVTAIRLSNEDETWVMDGTTAKATTAEYRENRRHCLSEGTVSHSRTEQLRLVLRLPNACEVRINLTAFIISQYVIASAHRGYRISSIPCDPNTVGRREGSVA